jgi:hypothetical protein
LAGTGGSWSVEATPDRPAAIPAGPAAGLPNSRRLRPGQLDALKHSLLEVLRQELFAPGSTGEQLWEHGLVSRLLADGSLGARTSGLLALIETPEAMEAYVLRSQGQDDAKRRASAASRPCRRPQGWPLGGAGLPDIARAGARRAGSPYPAVPARTPEQTKDGAGRKEIPPDA